MAETKTYGGYVYTRAAPDRPWVRGAPVQSQMPADPTFPYQGPKASADVESTEASAARSRSETQTEDATRPFVVRKAAAEAGTAEATFAKATGGTPEAAFAEASKTDNIISTIAHARALARKGGTGWGSYLAYLPATDARDLAGDLDTIRANLTFDRLQEMRENSPTGGAVGSASDTDMRLLGSTVASLDQGQSLDKVLDSLDRIEDHYKRFQAFNYGLDPDTPEGQKALKSAFPGLAGDDEPPQYNLGVAEQFATERDKQFAAVVQAAFDKGASAEEINALSKQYGYPPYDQRALSEAFKERANPTGRAINFLPPQSGYSDPSIYERAIQNIGASPVGTYFGQAANALTFGGLDEIQGLAAGDTIGEVLSGTGRGVTEANLKKQLQAQANPKAAVVGNLAGGVIGALGGGLATGGIKAAAALAPRAMLADALYGAAYGAGESNDDRLGGAALGGAAGVVGGAAGRGVVNKVGQAVGGVGGPGRALRDAGVTMTPGQIAESSGGTLGQYLKRREDRLAGYSGIGDVIGRKQRQGIEQFDRAAFREGLGEVPPQIAEEGVQYAEDVVVPRVYGEALDGKTFAPDLQLAEGLGAARARGAEALGELDGEFANTMAIRVNPFTTQPEVSGRDVQAMIQGLRKDAAAMSGKPRYDIFADATGMADETIADWLERQAPGTVGKLLEANRVYGHTQTLKDAVARAINTGGVFTPAQLGMAARASGKKFGGKQASTDRQFFELQRAGQQILPSDVPDSGTAGRQAAGEGITGTIKAALRNARIPLYSDPALAVMNAIAFDRPAPMVNIGDLIRQRQYLGGLIGAPAMAYASQ